LNLEFAMNTTSPAPFTPIAELLERTLSIRHVYGDPVQHGDTTVIPIAKVAYGFGAGGGRGPGRVRPGATDKRTSSDDPAEAQGMGGGGGVRLTPFGALEIGPRGTRFIRLHPLARPLGAVAIGLVVGWLLGRRSH
jgi:uncharacterized spore protein YtfJ